MEGKSTYTAATLAKMLNAELFGNGDIKVTALSTVGDRDAHCIFPVFKKKYSVPVESNQVALATEEIFKSEQLGQLGAILVHPSPIIALAQLIEVFYPSSQSTCGVHPSAVICSGCHLPNTVTVGPNAVIEENVEVGEGTIIGPGAIICGGTKIGRFVVIGPNAVVGGDGFGFIPVSAGIQKIPQVGGVELADFVEIGASVCIDKGTIGNTYIGQGSKIDNLVQVGHNCQIGKNVIIAAQSGLAGSTIIEDNVMLGGQVGVADHLRIASGAKVGAKSGVTRDVNANEVVSGYPAMPRWQWLRVIAKLKR